MSTGTCLYWQKSIISDSLIWSLTFLWSRNHPQDPFIGFLFPCLGLFFQVNRVFWGRTQTTGSSKIMIRRSQTHSTLLVCYSLVDPSLVLGVTSIDVGKILTEVSVKHTNRPPSLAAIRQVLFTHNSHSIRFGGLHTVFACFLGSRSSTYDFNA